jgi:Holliday junction resolvase
MANERGCPDIVACVNGRFVGMEVKAEAGHPTPLQLAQMERIRVAGGRAYVVKSLDEVKHIIKGMVQ